MTAPAEIPPPVPSPDPEARPYGSLGFFWGIIGACILVEGLLQLGDLGLLPANRVRATAYEYFGFWPGLLDNWRPNYAAQPYTMFLSYGFLHGGLWHLGLNMITLWSLGRVVIERVGQLRAGLIYLLSILGGATGFWLIAETVQPMVGASGALFGLAGALVSWNYLDRFLLKQGLLPVLQTILLLIALNVVLWWVMKGQLAWETHLGGFIAGWIAALLVDPRPRVI